MIEIALPDGSVRQFDAAITGDELAADISKSLAKKAVLLRLDGELKDLSTRIDRNCAVEIITRDHPAALETLRHDAAHVLAEAVKELYPETQITIGPVIENGFYYDFARPEPFSLDDLEVIEKRMCEIVDRDEPIVREVWDRDEAVAFFRSIGEEYKAEIIASIPQGEDVGLYRQGDWQDLCRGPHLPSTGKLGKAFKLTKLAGAYWRGDSDNEMLQRIYGTCWASDKELKAYLHMLEEAEKRDHRRLGREMDLFHFQEEGPGAVFWHPKGWTLFSALVNYMRDRQRIAGYHEVNTPELLDSSLWVASGHAEKFGEEMFSSHTPDERHFCIKPMNCPGHVQIFKQGIRSYRDLPYRMAEFGKVHRYEPSGALHGLMRLRAFTQDDAHIFCTEDQITEECVTVTNLILEIYRDFGFDQVRVKFSDRPEKRVGSDAIWDKSEAALKVAVEAAGLEYELNPGEGAFYGPKLEFVLRDAIGRDWQCGTLQVDLNLPGRLGASYIGEDGQKHQPVMLHRALFGSLERFAGILIEHHAGRFPLWLAPVQVVVATITSDADEYAQQVAQALFAQGVRVATDLRNEKINYKVREHSLQKVPVLFVVGRKEAEDETVSIRRLGAKQQQVVNFQTAIAALLNEIKEKQSYSGDTERTQTAE
ncbi:MAG TPA: threonine--tRNA ligase [Alphaproteobacteria bacterium]|nr:threonine--tRNA ligase [Alphaproteobacteria bacterium]HAM48942.1 threonine--tRNA ligase [Alphaproteobacteria bacterium]HBC54457.1 threonine--tRNA ligase [Alphaproteobacteria bacterium]HBF97859.1 threonine--tRNA ligase [Alphaproteobacteria bacterium]HCO91213.1 threonine--tRNA ligase [Alphaproteobacteria bacterium]